LLYPAALLRLGQATERVFLKRMSKKQGSKEEKEECGQMKLLDF
jgi:hypothetical protein